MDILHDDIQCKPLRSIEIQVDQTRRVSSVHHLPFLFGKLEEQHSNAEKKKGRRGKHLTLE